MRTRGYSMVAVLAVLTLLAILMGVMVQLLVTNLGQTRRRANILYATELARSGIDWARARLAAAKGLQSTVLTLSGGEIDVKVDAREGGYRVTSTGRVTRGGKVLEARVERVALGVAASEAEPPVVPSAEPEAVPTTEPPAPPER